MDEAGGERLEGEDVGGRGKVDDVEGERLEGAGKRGGHPSSPPPQMHLRATQTPAQRPSPPSPPFSYTHLWPLQTAAHHPSPPCALTHAPTDDTLGRKARPTTCASSMSLSSSQRKVQLRGAAPIWPIR